MIFVKKNCFLFDLDGTLVDSNLCHEHAYLSTIALESLNLNRPFSYEEHKGRPTRDVFVDLGIKDSELLSRLTKTKQRFYKDQIDAGNVELIAGALPVLEILQQLKHRIFLVTGASKSSTQHILNHLQIFHFFESIVTGDDVDSSKPAPDCYLKCLREARISPEQAIAIEDSLLGVESAQSAGLEVIIINNPNLSQMPEYIEDHSKLYKAVAFKDLPK